LGYFKGSNYLNALTLFLDLLKSDLRPTHFIFSSLLNSATGLADLGIGTQIHGQDIKCNFMWDVHVNNSLLNFSSKMNCLNHIRKLFDEMFEKNNITYNVVISGYSRNGLIKQALELFREMQSLGFDHVDYPFASLLSIAGSHSNHEIGRQIHAQGVQHGMASSKLRGSV
jgi:pentatricopeptide repeat protein